MVILGILTGLISGNVLNSLQKGRDARRKNDLSQVQKALELYYEDKKVYPTSVPFGGKFCSSPSCLTNDKVYMTKLPSDPNTSYSYALTADTVNGQYYYLFSCIENYVNDKGPGVSMSGFCAEPAPAPCVAKTCTGCGVCKYVLGSPNSTPLTPFPTPEE